MADSEPRRFNTAAFLLKRITIWAMEFGLLVCLFAVFCSSFDILEGMAALGRFLLGLVLFLSDFILSVIFF